MLVHGAALRRAVPHGGDRLVEAGRAIDEEFGIPQATPDQIVEHRAPGLGALAAMLLTASSAFCPSVSTPMTTSSEIAVALRSSRAHQPRAQNQPHNRLSASERAFQASHSPFTLRQVRLTMSLPTAPLNSAVNALDAPRLTPA